MMGLLRGWPLPEPPVLWRAGLPRARAGVGSAGVDGQHARHVARDHVHLEVDRRSWLQLPERRLLQRVGNQVDAELAAAFDIVHTIDREAHAVDRDRALVRE